MPVSTKITVAQFAQELRQKYPQHASMPDEDLVAEFINQNPKYAEQYHGGVLLSVDFEQKPVAISAGEPSINAAIARESSCKAAEMPYLGKTVIVKIDAVADRPKVGRYEIVDELGRGGMGVVYRAFDPGIGRTVALKVMSEPLARDAEFRSRFLQEARGAGILQHLNIVTVHELGEWQGSPFIAMEFLEGRSLEDILRNEKAMPLKERLEIVGQVCCGLEYAHARGIIHRDIKPANVMVTKDGVAKIVDFGIARLADQKLTKTGNVLGTVSYMSPELLHGQSLDGRSDIFAVGVMLFEALSSVLPFAAEDTASAITNILYRQPPKLCSFLSDYPRELDEILEKSLAKEPMDRFQTAGVLAERLARVCQDMQRSHSAPIAIRSTPLPNRSISGFIAPAALIELPKTGLSTKLRKVVIGVAGLSLLVTGISLATRWSHFRGTRDSNIGELTKLAESGDAYAQYKLGRAYELARGVQRDDVEAVRWLSKSAEQGNVHAEVDLGAEYCKGQGVRQDYVEATKWFQKAAHSGDALGQVDLGYQYEIGEGVVQDYAEAVRWYRRSAEQGNVHGQFNLGSMYLDGKGVPRDEAEGAIWYRKAADQGDPGAQNNLGSLYEEGRGVTKDDDEAMRWYRRAADQGTVSAQNNLKRLSKELGRGFAAL